jgi:uncharacterized membrane protein YqaE (UPF0057 family)
MKYVLALLLPPAAVLFYGQPRQVRINIVLTLLCWLPGVAHACLVVANSRGNRRERRRLEAMEQAWRQEELARFRARYDDRIAS